MAETVELVGLAFQAIVLALGALVVVLSWLEVVEEKALISLVGLGLAMVSVAMFLQ